MTTANAPFPNYNGIPYNRSFFASSSTTGITQAQSDFRYLQKNSPDTATSLETFSGGITLSQYSNITLSGGIPNSRYMLGFINPNAGAYQQNLYSPLISNRTYKAFNDLNLNIGSYIVYYNFRLFSTPSIVASNIEVFITSSASPGLKLATKSMQNQYIGYPVSNTAYSSPAFSGCCFISLDGSYNINVNYIINSTSLTTGNNINVFVSNTSTVNQPYEVANLYAMKIA